uniref:UBZ1-type domain-containing protein n=1 Tax=Glossina palpalis gambiensis TaxID=67801 RepID=A0A1B0BMH1_9MUSC
MEKSSSSETGQNLASQYALRVALQTMKERCMYQQKRLAEVEDDNQQLRERLTQINKPNSNNLQAYNGGGVAENFQLRLQLSELQRQNEQLNAHINMVSAENRKLWSRLSQMTKEQSTTKLKAQDAVLISNDETTAMQTGLATQNLIRSKTFTQHSPNPNLRHKLITADSSDMEMLDISLEEEALEAHEVENCIGQQGKQIIAANISPEESVGFGYLNVEVPNVDGGEHDFNLEAKKCIEGLQEMRREAMKQQQELSSVYNFLQNKIALRPCAECAKRIEEKPEMADKSLETDESLSDFKPYATNYGISKEQNREIDKTSCKTSTQDQAGNNHLNIVHEKLLADEQDKICPMCGKTYDSRISFDAFCAHVEEHFREDIIDLDHLSKEHNFELISHAVGDF